MSEYAFDPAAAARLVAELTPTVPTADEDTLRRYCGVLLQAVKELGERHWLAGGLADTVAADAADEAGTYGEIHARFLRQISGDTSRLQAAGQECRRQLVRQLGVPMSVMKPFDPVPTYP